MRVCKSTVRGLSGSSIAGRSECTAAAAVCGLTACAARSALTTGGGAWGGGLELLLLPLEEERCACATARYAASRAVASLEGASALLLRLGVWPYGLHGTQRSHHRWWCLVRRARAVALAPRGGEVRVCDSTVRGLSDSSIAGKSECTAAAAVYGLAACTARRALTFPPRGAKSSVVMLGEEGSSCCSWPLEEERCACAKARYAASQAVASLGEASARLLRLCVVLRPAQHAAHSPQVVVLGEEGSSCCSCRSWRRGARVRQHGTRPLRQ